MRLKLLPTEVLSAGTRVGFYDILVLIDAGGWKRSTVRLVNASILLAVSLCFLSLVFQLSRDTFWKSGVGDWMDPYFINALLEHCHDDLLP